MKVNKFLCPFPWIGTEISVVRCLSNAFHKLLCVLRLFRGSVQKNGLYITRWSWDYIGGWDKSFPRFHGLHELTLLVWWDKSDFPMFKYPLPSFFFWVPITKKRYSPIFWYYLWHETHERNFSFNESMLIDKSTPVSCFGCDIVNGQICLST